MPGARSPQIQPTNLAPEMTPFDGFLAPGQSQITLVGGGGMQVHSQLSLVLGERWTQLIPVEKAAECRSLQLRVGWGRFPSPAIAET